MNVFPKSFLFATGRYSFSFLEAIFCKPALISVAFFDASDTPNILIALSEAPILFNAEICFKTVSKSFVVPSLFSKPVLKNIVLFFKIFELPSFSFL